MFTAVIDGPFMFPRKNCVGKVILSWRNLIIFFSMSAMSTINDLNYDDLGARKNYEFLTCLISNVATGLKKGDGRQTRMMAILTHIRRHNVLYEAQTSSSHTVPVKGSRTIKRVVTTRTKQLLCIVRFFIWIKTFRLFSFRLKLVIFSKSRPALRQV